MVVCVCHSVCVLCPCSSRMQLSQASASPDLLRSITPLAGSSSSSSGGSSGAGHKDKGRAGPEAGPAPRYVPLVPLHDALSGPGLAVGGARTLHSAAAALLRGLGPLLPSMHMHAASEDEDEAGPGPAPRAEGSIYVGASPDGFPVSALCHGT